MVHDLTWVRLSNITNKKLMIFNNKTTFVFYLNITANGTCRSDEPSAETSSQKKPQEPLGAGFQRSLALTSARLSHGQRDVLHRPPNSKQTVTHSLLAHIAASTGCCVSRCAANTVFLQHPTSSSWTYYVDVLKVDLKTSSSE